MTKTYELWLHGKQGDDFGHILSEHKDDIPKSLRARFSPNRSLDITHRT